MDEMAKKSPKQSELVPDSSRVGIRTEEDVNEIRQQSSQVELEQKRQHGDAVLPKAKESPLDVEKHLNAQQHGIDHGRADGSPPAHPSEVSDGSLRNQIKAELARHDSDLLQKGDDAISKEHEVEKVELLDSEVIAQELGADRDAPKRKEGTAAVPESVSINKLAHEQHERIVHARLSSTRFQEPVGLYPRSFQASGRVREEAAPENPAAESAARRKLGSYTQSRLTKSSVEESISERAESSTKDARSSGAEGKDSSGETTEVKPILLNMKPSTMISKANEKKTEPLVSAERENILSKPKQPCSTSCIAGTTEPVTERSMIPPTRTDNSRCETKVSFFLFKSPTET